ncbi:MAG TPA: hypothetical protein VFY75_10470 [Solirubrobacterales bacterium]|nr:hypothetical protein [Solirubrobacterales bacterium]
MFSHGALAFLLLVALVFVPSAAAAVPSKGVVGFFGSKGTAAGQLETPRGVAVNQGSGNVYAIDGNRVVVFDQNGNFLRAFGGDAVAYGPNQAVEVQLLDVAAASGNYKLSFEGKLTPELSATAGAAEVEAALNGLSSISLNGGSVSVSGGPGSASGSSPFVIVFDGGPLNQENVAQLGTVNVSLAGGTPTTAITVGTSISGENGFEICVPAAGDACKGGASSAANGSMNAPQGIAVNQSSGDVYVTDQGNRRVNQYDGEGHFIRSFGKDIVTTGFPGNSPEASAVQTLTVTATGGKYVLKFGGKETGELAFNSTAAEIQAALQGLSSIGAGNATVSETTPGVFKITFAGNLANNPEPTIAAESGAGEPLTGGTASVADTTTGSNAFETCTGNDLCKAGAAAAQGTTNGAFASTIGYPAVAPAGAPNAGNLLVADAGNLRVQEFTASGAFVRAFGFDVVKGGPGNTGVAFEVCDAAAGDACKVGVTGAGSGQFATATPTRVAEDSAGNVYTVEPTTNFRVQKFTLPGNAVTPQGVFAEADLKGTSAATAPTDVAVNPSGNNVLVSKGFAAGATPSCPILGTPSVAESRVVEVSSAGALEGTHGACVGITPVGGLGVRGSGGNVFVSSTFVEPRIYVLNTSQPVAPTVSITNVSGVDAHKATINALINPNGPELPYGNETTYKLEYKKASEAGYLTVYNAEASAGNRTTAKAFALGVSGLEAGTTYDVRLTVNKGLGSGSASQTVSFATATSAPDVSLLSNLPVGGNAAILEGFVNPNNAASGYHFDYVSQAGFEANGFAGATRVPASDESAGSGGAGVRAAQEISGLDPGATYHYRLVASSAFGQGSAAGTFTTPADPTTCPNAKLRSEQTSGTFQNGSSFLPNCMGLELVTPPKKFNQYAVEGQIGVTDDRVVFSSMAALDSPRLGSILDKYLASRSGSGWSSHAMQMGSNYTNGNVATGLPCAYAPDLSNWTTYASTESQAKLGIVNVLQQNAAGEVFRLGPVMTPYVSPGVFAVGNSPCLGGTADGSHFYFTITAGVYGPEDPNTGGNSSVYDVYNTPLGEPRSELITRDRFGNVVGGPCGSWIPGKVGVETLPAKGSSAPDGSYLYFSTNLHQPLRSSCNTSTYPRRIVRRDLTSSGPELSEVGTSECTRTAPACSATDGSVQYMGATYDGSKVFFTTTRQLADTDLDSGSSCATESTSAGCDLYEYDYARPPGSRLIQISAGDSTDPTPGQGAEVLGIVDSSGDGSHVYFVARGVLTTAPNGSGATAKVGDRNLYMYQRDAAYPAGRTVFIGALASSDSSVWTSNNSRMAVAVPALGQDPLDYSQGGDGHVLALLSGAALTPDDSDGGFIDFYRYDAETDRLERVSRAAPGGSDNGPFDVSFEGTGAKSSNRNFIGNLGAEPGARFLSRRISEDGNTVAFVTAENLSPEDPDSLANSYIWTGGRLTPVPTSGTPSVSLSGKQVVFTTGSQLLVEDGDGASDVYAARVDGGFPIPVPPVLCTGEACQGAPGAQPANNAVTTETAPSSGNVKEKAKKKKKHKKKHKSKKHKKKRGGKNRAGTQQGGRK